MAEDELYGLSADAGLGGTPAVGEDRRKESRRIVGLKEIMDAIPNAKVGYDGGSGGVFGG
ncbi:hypothetical protein L484_013632 [Morus notabilis]|uniref:Uncharacterized protein n=1 Tax=Morus notabilis TaxID=981085 RepID=W9QUN4_9ROSA|nr:hypothetical protein L484_013632 [Morus notabilis]